MHYSTLIAQGEAVPRACCGCRQHTLRIPTGDIHDPVKRDLEKSLRERQQLMPTRLRTPPVAGKETLNTTLWDKLESTPCGHHMDHDGNYVTKALTPEELLLRKSDVVFDDYNVATGDLNAVSSCLYCAQGCHLEQMPAVVRRCFAALAPDAVSVPLCSSP